jgi:exonuclease III
MDMKFGTWNVKSLYRAGSLKTVAIELSKCRLDLVAVQEVSWDKGDSQPSYDYTFFYGNETANYHIGTGFFVHQTYMKLLDHWSRF